ncbi:hypothetical protein [Superficieibacter sp. HKU1]|uniref:hypothetical protein n=1 Tax=Superficieibacter sp. HKU1 TaxID=3031919 RepID=UPI0023E32270|nr:hypothetical protein [Superficieibacter sp. HKU1]WES67067.1 hypothetical protein P0H77_15655 [Superficieibacter sp. HKU1]
MMISKIPLVVLCLCSALGGAVVTGFVLFSGEGCEAKALQNHKDMATKKFWEGKDEPGPSKGF